MASLQSRIFKIIISKLINFNKPLSEIRKYSEKQNGHFVPPDSISFKSVLIDGVKAEWIIPHGSDTDKVIMYLHGGGYCLGLTDITRDFASRLSTSSGIPVLLVDYRLAPEHPYPAAFQDAMNVYKWLLDEGFASDKIAFAGDSSGGGLCLSLLLVARDTGLDLPSVCVALCPVTDMTGSGKSFKTKSALDPFSIKDPLAIAKIYFTNCNPKEPRLSPLFSDLHGFPSLLIHSAEHDVFEDDALRFAEKAKAVGTVVFLSEWKEMWHVFQMCPQWIPEVRNALKEVSLFIKNGMSEDCS